MTTETPVVVRSFRKSDGRAVCALYRDFVAYFHRLGHKSGSGFTETAFRRDCFGSSRALTGWVAVSGKKAVGYLIAHPGYNIELGSRLLFVADFFVATDYRRKGVGTSLIRAAATHARTKGIKGLTWDVHKSDSRAIKFYKGIGGTERPNFTVMLLEGKPFERLAKT